MYSQFYSYLSTQGDSPIQTSRHTAVRQEISLFSKFLSTNRKNLTKNEISEVFKHDLQKILAWFKIDFFANNLDLISVAKKNSNHKIQMTKPYWLTKHIRFGTLNGLIHHLLIY